jgi:hypothetical protein
MYTVELGKVGRLLKGKPPEEMTPVERWAIFMRYSTDVTKRDLMNRILFLEGGINMAANVLVTITKDDVERARLFSEYKYALDRQSEMVEARRSGEARGMAKGMAKGRAKGRAEGITKGITQGIQQERRRAAVEQAAKLARITQKMRDLGAADQDIASFLTDLGEPEPPAHG